MSNSNGPDMSADTLVDILPVAQQRRTDDVTLAVTSLERYTDGFVVNIRIDWEGVSGPLPHLKWRATDDTGVRHFCSGCGGSGGGPRPPLLLMRWTRRFSFLNRLVVTWHYRHNQKNSWRMHCPFSYATPPEATELTLELESFGLNQPIMPEDVSQPVEQWVSKRETHSVGSFVISLVPNA